MKMIEIEAKVDKEGKIVIPSHVLNEMKIQPEDSVRLTCISNPYNDSTKSIAEYIISPSSVADIEKMEPKEKGELSLPNVLLEAAGIPYESDLDIVCTEGAIIITKADLLDMIPDELRQLFSELGISPETVCSVIRSGGVFDEQ